MEKMINLNDLLKHEILDLYSAEEQIIEAMPAMIEKAKDQSLKKALKEHLKITEGQKTRLDKVKALLNKGSENSDKDGKENKGFFSRLFGGKGGSQKCRGVEGLIEEGEKVMGEDMSPEVLDAAIIASAQKIEHYEICGYGTARAYARELNLGQVAELLEETLDEEYEADDRLTDLAVGRINEEAETARAGRVRGNGASSRGTQKRNGSSPKSSNGKSIVAKSNGSSGKSNGSAAVKSSGRINSPAKGKKSNNGAGKSSTVASRNSGKSSSVKKSGGGKAASGSRRAR